MGKMLGKSDTPTREISRTARRFGELAVANGYISNEQLQHALKIYERKCTEHRTKSIRLGDVLRELKYLDTEDVRHILGLQNELKRSRGAQKRSTPLKAITPVDKPRPLFSQNPPVVTETEPHGENVSSSFPIERQLPVDAAASTESSPSPALAIEKLGDFVLLQKLGSGAMGTVYLAEQCSLGRKVALKLLPPELAQDEEYLDRFRKEARAAAKLNHPHIVLAYDVGVADGYHYIAMEHIEGCDLDVLLGRQPQGRLSEEETLKVAEQMTRALQAAHRAGIVHRDIKPANILRNKEGQYKLTDLGLAARKDDKKRFTSTGAPIGTPLYISPEQARGDESVDIRSDLYSLGATLYHLCTGRVPFTGEQAMVVMTKHLLDELEPPCEVEPTVSKGLSRLIEKCMAKRPEDRPQSPEEMLQDLETVHNGGIPLLRRARTRGRTGYVPPVSQSATLSGHSSGQSLIKRSRLQGSRANARFSQAPSLFKRRREKGKGTWVVSIILFVLAAIAFGVLIALVLDLISPTEKQPRSAPVPAAVE